MRARELLGGIAAMVIVLSCALLAQEVEEREAERPEPQERVRRIIVKRYTAIGAAELYRAIGENVRADVRFRDEFDRPVQLTGALRTVRLGGRRVRIGAAFRAEKDICCLVPLDARDQAQKVRDLRRGQMVTVEGTVLGIIAGNRCVLVDMVLTGAQQESVIQHELILEWPARQRVRPELITEPGDYEVGFPCRWQEGEEETVRVLVEQRVRAEFLAELKELEEIARGGREEKDYRLYKASAVYDYARDDVRIDVSFEDRIKGPTRRYADLNVVRLRGRRPIRIGYAFDTYQQITCLIPDRDEELLDRARRALPGQDVMIKGTVVGRVGAYRAVLVDELDFPSLNGVAETPDVWVVEIVWGEQRPMPIWRPGTYRRLFPCRFVEGRAERLDITLREVRLIGGRKGGKEGAGE